jgi:hypothetical protein
MKRLTAFAIALSLSACPNEGPGLDEVQLKLSETDLPGVFQVETVGIDPKARLWMQCDDGIEGWATVIDGLWLAARDRIEVETKCSLKAELGSEESYTSAKRSLRKGMLEAQRQALDPRGDSGLDAWETRALGDLLQADLPSGIGMLAWLDQQGRLVARSASGKGVWRRKWNADGLGYERLELEGVDPFSDDAPQGLRRLFAYFENPQAPDLIAIPAPTASLGNSAAEHGDLSASSSRAALMAWGAGVVRGETDEGLDVVDLAPSLASAMDLGMVLGRGPDGSLSWTQMRRQDGQVRSDFIAANSSEQVLIIAIDGLGTEALAAFIERSNGFKRMRDEGLWMRKGLLAGYPSNTMPGHNSLGSGLWPGHHGIYDNAMFGRDDNAVLDLVGGEVFRGSRARFRASAETLHQALASRPAQDMDLPWSLAAGSPSFVGATTNALEGSGPGGEGWINIGREAGFADLPQAPEWASGTTYALWETSIMLAEYTLRMITGQQVAGERPTYSIANWPIYDLVAHQYGAQSEQAFESLAALDFMLERLLDALARRRWQDKFSVILTADHGMTDSEPELPRPAWWSEGNPWAEQGIMAHSVLGAITIEAMAYDKRIDTGFVTFNLRDADNDRDLAGVSLTLYDGDGLEVETRIGDEAGTLSVPQPNNREIWGVLRAAGYSDLRVSAAEFQL